MKPLHPNGNLDIFHIVHEIGNPLNGMLTTIQLMERRLAARNRAAGDELIASSLGDLKSEVVRLQQILSDVRSYSENRTVLKPADLSRIIAYALRIQFPQLHTHGIRLIEEYPRELPPVLADETKLQQVLLNLFKNSMEAMPHGGTLKLRTYRRKQFVVLEIADTGVGMSKNLNVFRTRTTTKAGGMGMGLPIVRDIIAAHRGNITYDTTKGRGTTFRLSLLPAYRSKDRARKPARPLGIARRKDGDGEKY